METIGARKSAQEPALHRLHADQRGLSGIENLLIGALVVVACSGAWRFLGDRVSLNAKRIADTVDASVDESFASAVGSSDAAGELMFSTTPPVVAHTTQVDSGMSMLQPTGPVHTLNMGTDTSQASNPSTRIPGAGGYFTAQQSNERERAQPSGTPVGGDRTNTRQTMLGDKGKKVGPEYFDKAQQLKDLLNPQSELKGNSGSVAGQIGQKDGQSLLNGVSTTVTADSGKNHVSDQEKHSTPGVVTPPFTPSSGEVTTPYGGDHVRDAAGNNMGSSAELRALAKDQWTGGLTQNDLAGVAQQGGECPPSTENAMADLKGGTSSSLQGKNYIVTEEDAERVKAQQEKEPIWVDVRAAQREAAKKANSKKTPNPETDTGDGHNPNGGILGAVQKAPKSLYVEERERRQQVTMPGEGPAQPERVYLSTEDALNGGIRKNTDGRIDPVDPQASAVLGTPDLNRPVVGPEGFGPTGQPGGNTPDNPTAEQGPLGTEVPTTSLRRNGNGTSEDSMHP